MRQPPFDERLSVCPVAGYFPKSNKNKDGTNNNLYNEGYLFHVVTPGFIHYALASFRPRHLPNQDKKALFPLLYPMLSKNIKAGCYSLFPSAGFTFSAHILHLKSEPLIISSADNLYSFSWSMDLLFWRKDFIIR